MEIRSSAIRPVGILPALHLTFNFAHLLTTIGTNTIDRTTQHSVIEQQTVHQQTVQQQPPAPANQTSQISAPRALW